jgi:serine protease Do
MGKKYLSTMMLLAGAGVTVMAQPTPPAQPVPPRTHGSMVIAMRGPRLGVGVMDIDADRAKALKLREIRGAEVTRVDDGTPAAKAGIKAGDVILEYNGQPVQGTEELIRMVRETPLGRQVKVDLWRNGAPLSVMVTVEEGPLPNSDGDNWPFGGNMPSLPSMPSMPPMPYFEIPRMVTTFQSAGLGTDCESLSSTSSSQLAEFFGVKDGLLVRSVVHNSPAEKAGVKAGDVIVKLGDSHIATNRELSAALRANRGNAAVPLTVVRNKHEMALTITLQDSGREHF